MKLLLDVKENKAAFVMELLRSFRFIKTEAISAEKALLIKELKQAGKELALYKNGKLELRSIDEILNEL